MSKAKAQHKTARFSLEPDGFSIHTFELSRKISRQEYYSIKEKLYRQQEMCSQKGWMYKDENSDHHVCTRYKRNGIRLWLEHCGGGETDACFVRMVVNPRKLIDPCSTYLGILPPVKSSVSNVAVAFANLFVSSPFEENLDAYKLRRVDLCTNIRCNHKKLFRELVRVLRKLPTPPKYERLIYKHADKKKANQYNKHYLRFHCGTHELIIYDKTYQIQENGLVSAYEDLPKGVLRFEVHCERAYLRKIEKNAGDLNTSELLWLLIQSSEQRLVSHFSRCFSDVSFAQKDELDGIIKTSRYRKETKAAMYELVERMQRTQSVDKALKDMTTDAYEAQDLLSKFDMLGISPIPLWKNFCAKRLPGPVELLKGISGGDITVEYVRLK